jgi:hypothetical protein
MVAPGNKKVYGVLTIAYKFKAGKGLGFARKPREPKHGKKPPAGYKNRAPTAQAPQSAKYRVELWA